MHLAQFKYPELCISLSLLTKMLHIYSLLGVCAGLLFAYGVSGQSFILWVGMIYSSCRGGVINVPYVSCTYARILHASYETGSYWHGTWRRIGILIHLRPPLGPSTN